eukprot:GHVS01101507.1.p1 GENE.GHVS01101507.1~~GHVS01101507.1.p1  ORF type:complete len:197 (-),score=36.03 GHVS01101507.1:182-772(-)
MVRENFNSPYEVEKRRHSEAVESLLNDDAPVNHSDIGLVLFPDGSLRNSNNTPISQNHLKGKSVALYFADSEDPKCLSFLPFLLQFYRTLNASGDSQKIEIIFVSLDHDHSRYQQHRSHMPWLAVDLCDPLTDVLKQHYRILKENEVPRYGGGPRSSVPALVVIGEDGREAQFLDVAAEQRLPLLRRWDFRNTIFS